MSRLIGMVWQIMAGSAGTVPRNFFSSTYTMPDSRGLDFDRIDAYVTAQMQADRIPGLALGIVEGNRVVYLRGYGKASADGRPVTPQTSFMLGSVSKSFTSLAVMQLVEQGKISLDAPVQEYIHWFNVGNSPESDTITVRHLLNQTSGIPTYAGAKALAGDGTQTIKQRVRELSDIPLSTPVGKTFHYSEDNSIVLSLIVQTVSGQPFGQYIQEHIFAPLQMQHSFVDQSEAERNGMAQGYRWWFGLPVAATLPYPADALGASFLISSAEDMTHYLIAQLNGGSYAQTSLLSTDSIAEMHRPVAPVGTGDRYAMGWVVGKRDEVQVIWHGGDTANFHADVVLVPERQLGIVLLNNANNALIQAEELGKIGRIAAGVTRMVLGKQPVDDVLSVNTFYWLFDTFALLLLLIQSRALLHLLRRSSAIHRSPVSSKRFLYWLPLTWELVLPGGIIVLFRRILKHFDVPLSLLALYAPDFSFWLLCLLSLLSGTAILRVI